MSILNRRNALVGWVAVKLGKRVVKKKAADAVTSPKAGGAAGALAAIGGALLFWKKTRSDGSDE